MKNEATKFARVKVIAIVVVVFAGLAVFLSRLPRGPGLKNDYIDFRKLEQNSGSVSDNRSPAAATTPAASPGSLEASPESPRPDSVPTPATGNNPSPANGPLSGSFVGTLKLIIPVVGVKPDQLLDTFADARSEGRVHDAIDIPAPAGTQVVAAADGEVIRLFQSERGGTTIYQLSTDKKLVYYYAHLQGYADGLTVGKFVHQGELIAYVGDTGNAGTGNYHLHFSIAVTADPKRYWEGTNINPYPLLHK